MSLEKDNGFQNPFGVLWFSALAMCLTGYLIVDDYLNNDPPQWLTIVFFIAFIANTWFLAKDKKKETTRE